MGGHTVRCYRGTANNKKDDPDFSVETIKVRVNLTQSNLLAAGGKDQLIKKTRAVMKNSGKKKKKKPTIVVTIPGCNDDYSLKIAKQVQAYEDHKFGMHAANIHQQETADIISMNRNDEASYTMDHVVELPLFKVDGGDYYEEINKDFFNEHAPSDEFSLQTVFSLPQSIPMVVMGTSPRDILIGFLTVCVCVKGTYCDLKANDVEGDEAADEFEDEFNNFFGSSGADDDEDEGKEDISSTSSSLDPIPSAAAAAAVDVDVEDHDGEMHSSTLSSSLPDNVLRLSLSSDDEDDSSTP